MIDLNPSAMTRKDAIASLLEAIDTGGLARKREERRYLGASGIGHECARKVQLDYMAANGLPGAPKPGKGFEPRTLRIFDRGHAMEELAIRWLKDAGFQIKTHDRDGKQFGFKTAGGRFAGHCDGVLIGGPDGMAYPALFEHKALGSKGWQKHAKSGVAVASPAYASQISLYQAYLSLTENPALFMATNADTLEIYLELVPFNGKLAQEISDKAANILQSTDAGEFLPKAFSAGDFWVCRSCDFHSFCWK